MLLAFARRPRAPAAQGGVQSTFCAASSAPSMGHDVGDGCRGMGFRVPSMLLSKSGTSTSTTDVTVGGERPQSFSDNVQGKCTAVDQVATGSSV
eukprot:372994-Prymnesium_polylepis.1